MHGKAPTKSGDGVKRVQRIERVEARGELSSSVGDAGYRTRPRSLESP